MEVDVPQSFAEIKIHRNLFYDHMPNRYDLYFARAAEWINGGMKDHRPDEERRKRETKELKKKQSKIKATTGSWNWWYSWAGK